MYHDYFLITSGIEIYLYAVNFVFISKTVR